MTQPLAVVTGANRGLGYETCRQLGKLGYAVIMISRQAAAGEKAAAQLQASGLRVQPYQLDVTDQASITRLAFYLQREAGRVHVLVNNAAAFFEPSDPRRPEVATALGSDPDHIRQSMETNALGALMMIQAMVPLMRAGGYGRIVNVSSGMAQLTHMTGGWPGYRISKLALNAITRMVAAEVVNEGILVNAACPGPVRTRMGNAEASQTAEQGVDTIMWLATLPADGPTGGFFRYRRPIAW